MLRPVIAVGFMGAGKIDAVVGGGRGGAAVAHGALQPNYEAAAGYSLTVTPQIELYSTTAKCFNQGLLQHYEEDQEYQRPQGPLFDNHP